MKQRGIWRKHDLKLLLGLIALMMMMSLLSGCAHSNPPRTIPAYKKEFLERVIVDEKSCGPAAKQALYDWVVLIGA